MADAEPPLALLRGIVNARRPLSRKLVFLDLMLEPAAGEAPQALEVALKASQASPSAQDSWQPCTYRRARRLPASTGLLCRPLPSLQAGRMTLDQVREAKDCVRLGDAVEVQGSLCAETGVLSACSLRMLDPWATSHPGEHFKPRPMPRAHQPREPGTPAGQRCARPVTGCAAGRLRWCAGSSWRIRSACVAVAAACHALL